METKYEAQVDRPHMLSIQKGCQKLVLACEVSPHLCRLGAGMLSTGQAPGWEPPLTAAMSTPQLTHTSLGT